MALDLTAEQKEYGKKILMACLVHRANGIILLKKEINNERSITLGICNFS